MSALTTKRIARLKDKMARYLAEFDEDHPQKELMLSEIARYEAEPEKPETDRMYARVETLVGAIRKVRVQMETAPPEIKARMEKRITQYQQSLKNIQEHGKETVHVVPEGVRIEVPVDVLSSGE